MELQPGSVRVVAVDVGSVARGNFGWFAADIELGGATPGSRYWQAGQGTTPSGAVDAVCVALADARQVALGLECPLFVPVPSNEQLLGTARSGEGRYPWSAGPGSNALVTGLSQLPWMLARVRDRAPCLVTTRPERWSADTPLLIWEAFVSGPGKSTGSTHIGDAEAAVLEFAALGAGLLDRGPVTTDHPVHNLAATAAMAAGLRIDHAELTGEVRVVKARPTS